MVDVIQTENHQADIGNKAEAESQPGSTSLTEEESSTIDSPDTDLEYLDSHLQESAAPVKYHRQIHFHWWQLALAFILTVTLVTIGTITLAQHEIHQQAQILKQQKKRYDKEIYKKMHKIVHSKECKKVIEEDLRETDPHALTDKGIIKTYTIVDSSITHNRSGGIDFIVMINNDKTLTIDLLVDRQWIYDDEYGPLKDTVDEVSGELWKKLEARYGKQIYDDDWAAKYRKAHPEEFPK